MLKKLLPFLIEKRLRLNEALSLRWENVDLKNDSLFIARGKIASARRTVPLTDRARAILNGLAKGGVVFDQSPFYVSRQFRALRDALRLPKDCVLHSCRHTFCTRLGAAHVSAYQIMRLAGHSSVSISQRYVHEDVAALRDAIARL